eukprot:CAMPEP_0202418840 /NCGR_PEP_ID=MMETSP1128-20130828/47541_1 /ASSEMBLY_ACC=CAM_ASM_000463 /TAXON_ID=3047 /ORGANISM="Dunaliella tertiolecta, Strain CCMP1320" /LENGTH=79 /DNA_ID=CAMNT_0049026617 /DNA_START=115 /DNA_END=351 /DNA_ORIENTATION=+
MSTGSPRLPERKRKVTGGKLTPEARTEAAREVEASPDQYAVHSPEETPERVLMAEKLRRINQNPALHKLLTQPNRITDV